MNSTVDFAFPTRPKGRASEAAEATYWNNVHCLQAWMRQYIETLGFAPSSRGWCYALESIGLITKGEFDKAIKTMATLRKTGHLGFDLVAHDDSRALNGEDVYHRTSTPRAHLEQWVKKALDQGRLYRPVSYWKHQSYYPIVMVEKIDLVNLFRPVLPPAVKIFNARGWADVNSRVNLVRECMWAEENGLEPVILYCGDHDPAGLQISDTLKGTLRDISTTLGYCEELWDEEEDRFLTLEEYNEADDYWEDLSAEDLTPKTDSLRVIRFGLNEAQIQQGNLSWIENLETSGGKDLANPKHPDHSKPYVKSYLYAYGPRKVEANALIANPALGRSIMRQAIWRFLDQDAVDLWEDQNKEARDEAAGMADKITAWLGLLDASGLLYNPPKKLPKPREMQDLMDLVDDSES